MVPLWCRGSTTPTALQVASINCRIDGRVEPIRGVALHILRDVRIAVERLGDGGVTQTFLDDLRMNAFRQQHRGAGVAQIVEANRGTPARAINSQPPGQRVGMDYPAILFGEDQEDNENHVRSGVIQFADWKDLPLCAKEWWYVVLDVYGHLSETHESRLRERGL